MNNKMEVKIMEKERREKLIRRIMLDVESNLLNYQEFVLDCVKDRVEHWEDEELLNWVNEE
jgi:hypothetical protein